MALPANVQQGKSSRAATIAAHAAFVPIGIVTIILGPLLPILVTRWSLNDTQAGALFTAQFLASTVAVALSGMLVALWGYRLPINLGLLAVALGIGALPFASHLTGLACVASYGFGLGLAVPAANLLVAEVNPTRRAAALNLLNFSWSVGAVACPFLIAAASAAHKIQPLLIGIAVFALVVMLGIAMIPAAAVEPVTVEHDIGSLFSSIDWKARRLPVLVALFFLYVGSENAYGGWSAAFSKSLGTLRPSIAVMIPSFFYSAIMLGRWAAPLVLRRIDDLRLARFGILVACVGMAGLIGSRGFFSVAASVSVAGIGLSAVYPITISLLAREFGAAASRVGSIMFTAANLGGSCLPFLVGFFSNRFHTLRVGLAVPLIASLSMYAFYRVSWRPSSHEPG